MTKFYVVGGRQRQGTSAKTDEWHEFDRAVILELNAETGSAETRVEHVTPPEACAPEKPSIVFKAATVAGQRLYACTTTEIIVYSLPDFERLAYVSLPCFNDVHHVQPISENEVLVANTGLDTVVRATLDGQLVDQWSVLGTDPWERFSESIDYRRVPTTKPHASHPNYIFLLDSEQWVTRCIQRDAICITDPSKTMAIGGTAAVHDGMVRDGDVWFTAVDGHVVQIDTNTGTHRRVLSLRDYVETDMPLGWCRGLEVLDENHVVVGFSRLRPTKLKENLLWLKRRLGASGYGLKPTRVAQFDFANGKLCWEHDLEPFGMNVVFSVHSVV